jgi:uncharacterized protein
LLTNTFSHIPGIGKTSESQIWRNDILSWKECLEHEKRLPFSNSKRIKIRSFIEQSLDAYNQKNHEFFLHTLDSKDHWRAYPLFKDTCCFLDIETTGLDKHRNIVTVIGIFDGIKSKLFVQGKNMHEFAEEIKKYSMVVTFNGRCFDIPFLQHNFPEIDFNKLHVDLRFALKELGFSGGLKYIEKVLGISRDSDIGGVDGYEAVRLWWQYKRGDENALQTLLKYNKADIENLKDLMDFAFSELRKKHFTRHLI